MKASWQGNDLQQSNKKRTRQKNKIWSTSSLSLFIITIVVIIKTSENWASWFINLWPGWMYFMRILTVKICEGDHHYCHDNDHHHYRHYDYGDDQRTGQVECMDEFWWWKYAKNMQRGNVSRYKVKADNLHTFPTICIIFQTASSHSCSNYPYLHAWIKD